MGACGFGGGKHTCKVDDFYVQKFHVMSINILLTTFTLWLLMLNPLYLN